MLGLQSMQSFAVIESAIIEPTYKPVAQREIAKVTSKDENFKSGFRRLKWGDSPADGMNELSPKGQFKGYAFVDEDTNVFGLNADLVSYYFKEGKFARFEIVWGHEKLLTGKEFAKLKKNLITAFGKPTEVKVLGTHRWKSQGGKFEIMLSRINSVTPESEGHNIHLLVELKK